MNREIRRTTCLIVLLTSFVIVGWSRAADPRETPRNEIQIVTTDESDTTKKVVEDFRKRFPSAQLLSDLTKRRQKKKNTLYITIGPTALRTLLSQGPADGVIVSTYTSSQAYRSIVDSMAPTRPAAITAVYADPAPVVQLRLISMLYKKPVGVAVILSSKTAYLEPILQRAASQTRTELTIENYASGENLNRALNRLADIPTILATPDSTVYNSENIRNILVTTYRRNQPVIGFSAALVKAGALASTYSDIEDINAHVDELISDFEASGKVAEPQFPKYFSVIVNEDVARSLNIVVDDSVKNFSRKPVVRQP